MNENNWRYWYKAAVLELNPFLVQIRVNEALAAINARAAASARVPRDELRDMPCDVYSARNEITARSDAGSADGKLVFELQEIAANLSPIR